MTSSRYARPLSSSLALRLSSFSPSHSITLSFSNSFFVSRYNKTLIYLSISSRSSTSLSPSLFLLHSRSLSLFYSYTHTYALNNLFTTHKISLFRSITLASTEFSRPAWMFLNPAVMSGHSAPPRFSEWAMSLLLYIFSSYFPVLTFPCWPMRFYLCDKQTIVFHRPITSWLLYHSRSNFVNDSRVSLSWFL